MTQHLAVGHPVCDQVDQQLVRERPEEVRDVGVHDPLRLPQLLPDPPHRHMCRTARAVAEARLPERRLKDRRKHLDERLLTHPIHDRRDAERALLGRPGLVDLDPLDGPWPIATIPELPVQSVEVVLQVLIEPGDGHAIDAASALVLLHALPRSPQIPPVIDLADQRVRLLRPHGSLAYRASRRDVTGLLTSAASVIAAAAISPTLATHPTPRVGCPVQRGPFPLDAAFSVAVPPPHQGAIPGLLLFPGS